MADTFSSAADADAAKMDQSQWRRSVAGTWERQLDEGERFYASIGQIARNSDGSCFPVTGCVCFRVPGPIDASVYTSFDSPTGAPHDTPPQPVSSAAVIQEIDTQVERALRQAWLFLRYHCPTLASWTEYDRENNEWTKLYSTLQSFEQEKWLSSTIVVVETDMTAIQWLNDDPPKFDCPTIFLLKQPALTLVGASEVSYTLLLRCPHDITDGIGILHLLQLLLAQASRAYDMRHEYPLPTFGDEARNLSPSLRHAASIPMLPTPKQVANWEDVAVNNRRMQTGLPLLGLPLRSASTPSGKLQYISLSLSHLVTSEVLLACKAGGWSITHAFSAAMVMALRDMQAQGQQPIPMRYLNQILVNLRHACCPPYNSNFHGAAVYHILSAQTLAVDLVVPPSTSLVSVEEKVDEFTAIAKNIQDFYKSLRGADSVSVRDQIAVSPLTWKSLTPPANVPSSGAPLEPDPKPDFSSVSLSSIGNISSVLSADHGAFAISDAWVTAEPLGPGVALFLGTWDGMLAVNVSFNTQWHEVQYIKEFAGHILEQLVTCLT